jgi:hypothetical protein
MTRPNPTNIQRTNHTPHIQTSLHSFDETQTILNDMPGVDTHPEKDETLPQKTQNRSKQTRPARSND